MSAPKASAGGRSTDWSCIHGPAASCRCTGQGVCLPALLPRMVAAATAQNQRVFHCREHTQALSHMPAHLADLVLAQLGGDGPTGTLGPARLLLSTDTHGSAAAEAGWAGSWGQEGAAGGAGSGGRHGLHLGHGSGHSCKCARYVGSGCCWCCGCRSS
jgi:hypothetical protein